LNLSAAPASLEEGIRPTWAQLKHGVEQPQRQVQLS
jgi:hypothetical protein